MFFQRNSNEIVWWELRRFLFNIIMLASGVLLLILLQVLKPIHIHSHYFYGYFEMIIYYGFLVNIIYTAVYIYFTSLLDIFIDSEKHMKAKKFTLNWILISGICLNILVGFCELYFRDEYLNHL